MTRAPVRESACTCERCVNMCRTRPCWPTPEEAQALPPGTTMVVEAETIDPATLQRVVVRVTTPAIAGREGQVVAATETGPCVFLQNDRCRLHRRGKPLEGRLAHHSVPWRVVREHVLAMWS